MRHLLRSWRVWWLALALVAAPQLSLVHALSHIVAADASQTADEERQPGAHKVCDTCLSLAHLGQALSVQPTWVPADGDDAAFAHVPRALGDQRAPAHFQARAPPFFL